MASKRHSMSGGAAFHAWATADGDPETTWVISRKDARSLVRSVTDLVEQLEAERKRAVRAGDAALQYQDERDAALEQLEVADTFARVADAYCWDPETTTHADLMNARAAWQSAVGRMRLRALDSNPASTPPTEED